MNRPKKKKIPEDLVILSYVGELKEIKKFQEGYNQCCDDWEKFLPTKNEILKILVKCPTILPVRDKGSIVEAFSKRLRRSFNGHN